MKKAYIIRTKKREVKKSIAGFEHASFTKGVHLQNFCNAIPTRPIGTRKKIDVKYICTC